MRWAEVDGVRSLEASLPGARAAFTTRLGGVSEGPFESLNLGLLTGDDRDAVAANRRRAAAALGSEVIRVL
ncbi:MAG: purine-nucleoside/S-methyl-5-thioadenosine phosphorylase / adenosine deaminase, partial [Solirubrobacterales bacterium]|nr:purine-nucleoside/S-methyl-5-thioadenosine phosphorylase / adenosine deaminase [Solirubrobacterales bacterium]